MQTFDLFTEPFRAAAWEVHMSVFSSLGAKRCLLFEAEMLIVRTRAHHTH